MRKKKGKKGGGGGGGNSLAEVAAMMAGASLEEATSASKPPRNSPSKRSAGRGPKPQTPSSPALDSLSNQLTAPAGRKAPPPVIRVRTVTAKRSRSLDVTPEVLVSVGEARECSLCAGSVMAVCARDGTSSDNLTPLFTARVWPSSELKPGCVVIKSNAPEAFTARLRPPATRPATPGSATSTGASAHTPPPQQSALSTTAIATPSPGARSPLQLPSESTPPTSPFSFRRDGSPAHVPPTNAGPPRSPSPTPSQPQSPVTPTSPSTTRHVCITTLEHARVAAANVSQLRAQIGYVGDNPGQEARSDVWRETLEASVRQALSSACWLSPRGSPAAYTRELHHRGVDLSLTLSFRLGEGTIRAPAVDVAAMNIPGECPSIACKVCATTLVEYSLLDARDTKDRDDVRAENEAEAGNGELGEPSTTKDEWGNVGGLGKQIVALRDAIETPLQRPEIYASLGVDPPRGVLLSGPPGTGKTTIARVAARATGAHVVLLNGAELTSKYIGETESALQRAFDDARSHAPSLVVIDELDALAPARADSQSSLEKRVVSTLLALMDGIHAKGMGSRLVVIGATNRPHALDPALRRPGRFDLEIETSIPATRDRVEILRILLRDVPCDASVDEETLASLAGLTNGFVGADLKLLCSEAVLSATRRSTAGTASELTEVGDEAIRVSRADLEASIVRITPSALREASVEIPEVRWDDIGGLWDLKANIREIVEWPVVHADSMRRLGLQSPKGALLYGPPGCSKTLMAKALATETRMNFLAVQGPELLSQWLGESEKAVQKLFRRARAAAPTIVFFDEIDAIAARRGAESNDSRASERLLTQLLVEMDGVSSHESPGRSEADTRVVVIAATNRPDMLDDALLRPGRLDRLIYVPPPDAAARADIIRVSLKRMPHAVRPEDFEELAVASEGLSGAEVTASVRDAALHAIANGGADSQPRTLDAAELLASIHRAQRNRNITPDMLRFYEDFRSRGRRTRRLEPGTDIGT